MSFTNKVVIVTGGSSGIGAATVEAFAKEGAKVVIVGRNEVKLKQVADKCDKLNADYLVVKADVAIENDAKRIINDTIQKYEKVDILVNNAGIGRFGGVIDGGLLNVYDEVMNTNLKAAVVLTCLAAPYLIKTKGNIVNISSIAGVGLLNPTFSAYNISKAGLNMFSRVTALEMAPHGVRVNVISPGPVRTDIFQASGATGNVDDLKKLTALGRISEPEEIADLIIFLASDNARSITGSNYLTDNGSLLIKA